ncbi:methylated-DNA--[protein]-cysteine S-methyltransferase [Pseudodonghicola flavimaris]|uniref:Methylated-DNA--[protein]-cysteine S-methyltransferase n=1 Tax=Pseudodonghicola flavimaris TaxID=3050036 RepID=A0ABT7EXV2_9RHOB|nr:methylated-DNA--[protein]-cysteine S-methyltransferase [Pseudodonghicola flavimaris]MDK3017173.1 methylated-DNA--[protein]-cysteine S-methyltransferase [Pseudodonghicola flavimaris]
MATIRVPTQFGVLSVTAEAEAIVRVRWDAPAEGEAGALLEEAAAQIAAYDAGQLARFDLPFRVRGSDFQRAVCAAMAAIPFGETRTYGEIATDLGAPARAVGGACGSNPIPVLIPCHRVMGAGGRLTGFSGQGGVETKVALLRHEGAGGFLI